MTDPILYNLEMTDVLLRQLIVANSPVTYQTCRVKINFMIDESREASILEWLLQRKAFRESRNELS